MRAAASSHVGIFPPSPTNPLLGSDCQLGAALWGSQECPPAHLRVSACGWCCSVVPMEMLSGRGCEMPQKGENTGVSPLSTLVFRPTRVAWEIRAALAGWKHGGVSGEFSHLIFGLPSVVGCSPVPGSHCQGVFGGLCW